jgi:tetratricopeptide (TPR) repeat protein
VEDERTLAAYRVAEAFYPFWLYGSGVRPSAQDLEIAREAAEQALTVARRMDDANLQSSALDALSSADQIKGDWRSSREHARARLAFQDRLNMVEKIDAHCMVVWSSCLLGDLDEADRIAAAGLARVQPGQVPAWTLHLVAWRIYALTLLGRWDEALSLGERARQLWIESGKPSAGYANRGFYALVDVARARQDAALVESVANIIETITASFPKGNPNTRWLGLARADLDAVTKLLESVEVDSLTQTERVERALGLASDHGRAPAAEPLNAILEAAQRLSFRPLEAQAWRALGLLDDDAEAMRRSLAIWKECAALPSQARLQCELGILTEDQSSFDAGAAVLERLGDRDQLGRYEPRRPS